MVFCAEIYDVQLLALDTEVLSTTIAIIFSVPLTQRTVLNTDLGADSCGVHIVENGSSTPDKRNYIYQYIQFNSTQFKLPIKGPQGQQEISENCT